MSLQSVFRPFAGAAGTTGAYIKEILLGTVVPPPVGETGTGTADPQRWMDTVCTGTALQTTEEWDIINLTIDGE